MKPVVLWTKQYPFSAIHQLPELSAAQCCSVHGHLYKLRLTFRISIDPNSGLGIARDEIDRTVETHVTHLLQGEFINNHMEFSSGEFICQALYQRLAPLFPENSLVRASLQETRKNWFGTR